MVDFDFGGLWPWWTEKDGGPLSRLVDQQRRMWTFQNWGDIGLFPASRETTQMNKPPKHYTKMGGHQVEKNTLQRDKYLWEETWIDYFLWKYWICAVNDKIIKNVINICHNSHYQWWSVNCECSITFGTLELLFPISKKDHSCFVPKRMILVSIEKG